MEWFGYRMVWIQSREEEEAWQARRPLLPRSPRCLVVVGGGGLVKTGDRRGWAFIVGERGIRGEQFRLGRRNGPGCAGRAYWSGGGWKWARFPGRAYWGGGMQVGPDSRDRCKWARAPKESILEVARARRESACAAPPRRL